MRQILSLFTDSGKSPVGWVALSVIIAFFLTVVQPAWAVQQTVLKGTAYVQKDDEKVPLDKALVVISGVPMKSVPALKHPVTMDQRNQTFVPHILPVLKGQAVFFENSDNINHNVRLTRESTGEELMNAYQLTGQNLSYSVEETGIISVTCDIHPWMQAYIVVVDKPFVPTYTTRNGKFNFTVPYGSIAGRFKLRIWSEQYGWGPSRTVSLSTEGPAEKVTIVVQPEEREPEG